MNTDQILCSQLNDENTFFFRTLTQLEGQAELAAWSSRELCQALFPVALLAATTRNTIKAFDIKIDYWSDVPIRSSRLIL